MNGELRLTTAKNELITLQTNNLCCKSLILHFFYKKLNLAYDSQNH